MQVATGVLLILCGLAVLRFNRRIGEIASASNREAHDPRYSLLNRERAERVQDAEADPALNRLGTIFMGVVLLVAGAATVAGGLGIGA